MDHFHAFLEPEADILDPILPKSNARRLPQAESAPAAAGPPFSYASATRLAVFVPAIESLGVVPGERQ